ncbi:MAG: DUF4139 domain-containing protein [Bacteroidales bacterium]|nr:DUF4139 domain-containing protein [Bacteroidales bacterium]
MKTYYLTLILLCSFITVSSQEAKSIQSHLQEATIFFRGAELVHITSAILNKGQNEIQIEGLSPDIDRNSLKVKTSNGVVVSMHEFSVDYLRGDKSTNSYLKNLQDSLSFQEKSLQAIQTDISITNNMLSLLQKGIDKNVDGSDKGLSIDELIKTMDYYKFQSKELYEKQSENNTKKHEIESVVTRLRNQINQENISNNKTTGILKLTLSSPISGKCNFEISYYTPSASWIPYYGINVDSTDKPIKINGKAKVFQTTGLDWNKIKLTLSTTTPGNGKIAPLFSAWFLNYYTPTPSAGLQGRISGLNAITQNSYSYEIAESVDEEIIEEPEESAMNDYISFSQNELNISYAIDMPYTIPGNGKEQNIDLQTKETIAEYKYYCAPKLDTETYLLGEIANWQQLNLLSGKANITYEGTYVGESYIDTKSTHEKLSLTLGTDKRVNVKREKLHDFSSTKSFGNDIKQVFTYKLTVRNNQNIPIQMVLKDQYPISTRRNIEVELLTKETTPWTHNVKDIGVITWEEELKAGETKVYQISYSVKYPKGTSINL